MKLRAAERDAVLEEFGQQLLHAMDRAVAMGLPAERVRTLVEESAVNWKPEKPKRARRSK